MSIVAFSDRKKFLFWYPGAKVGHCKWVQKGERWTAKTSNRPLPVTLQALITPNVWTGSAK
jgi:hypothetical protein